MKQPVFKGVATALVTPFKNDGSIDFETFAKQIDFQLENGINALVVCGTTGESPTLNDVEHKQAIDFVVSRVAHAVPVIAGTGSNDTEYSVSLCQHAQKAGVDALLLVTPYYNKATQKGLIKHYTYIADRVELPMILYNVPGRTGVDIKPETSYELSKHPNINALKEANGNISSVAKTASLCGDNLAIYSGNDDQIIPILSLGGLGVISVLSNVLPKQTVQMCDEFFKGNIEAARKLQLDYLEFINNLFIEVNPIPVKAAMKILGSDSGCLRLPLCDISESNLEILKHSMEKIGII